MLREAAARISGDTPRLDAELLLAHVLGVERLAMLASMAAVPEAAAAAFEALVERRARHEPVAHLLGRRDFWTAEYLVTPDVLIPRPDSETLIEAALELKRGRRVERILDLGVGSGALLLAALSEWPEAFGLGVDRSIEALAVARANARRLGMDGRTAFICGDWAQGIGGKFDLVLCNPPYVPDGEMLMAEVARFEPASALYGGADGLDCYRRLLPDLRRFLAAGGVALFEFGAGQEDALAALAVEAGWTPRFRADLAGRPRVLIVEQEARGLDIDDIGGIGNWPASD